MQIAVAGLTTRRSDRRRGPSRRRSGASYCRGQGMSTARPTTWPARSACSASLIGFLRRLMISSRFTGRIGTHRAGERSFG